MTPQQINKRIALACGWKHLGKTFANGVLYYDAWESQEGTLYTYPPNYHGDLNAMHEAEKTIRDRITYTVTLYEIARRDYEIATEWSSLIHATAAQRAEAFLRTLGKWEDGE